MPKHSPAKTRSVCPDLKNVLKGIDANIQASAVKVERQKNKYRCKKVLMDSFFVAMRHAETAFGLLIGLERSRSLSGTSCATRSVYNVLIDGVPHRVESLQGCIDFLNGYTAGIASARGAALSPEMVARSGGEAVKVMG